MSFLSNRKNRRTDYSIGDDVLEGSKDSGAGGTPLALLNTACIIFLFIALAAIAAISFSGLASSNNFVAIQHLTSSLTSSQHSHIVTEIEDGVDLYISVCTDAVPAPGKTEFKGRTIIAYNCPDPLNECSINNCNSTSGTCVPSLIPGAECFLDNQCGVGSACNIETCQCQMLPNSTTGCTVDDDCPDISDRGICADYECSNDARCVEIILEQGVCWSDSQCDSATEFCDQSICNCVPRPTNQCQQNSDCTDVSDRGGSCSANVCQLGICVETTFGECWYSGQCASGEMCDTDNCLCVPSTDIQCLDSSNCLNVTDRGMCVTNDCQNQTCVEVTLGDCWFDGQCAQNEFCNQTSCACDLAPAVLCQQDSDCTDVSDRGPCVENRCESGLCVETVLGECWFDAQCTDVGATCDLGTCSCVVLPTPACSFDFQCPNITDRGMCVDYECQDNLCVEVTNGECWYSEQCPVGQVCDVSTCGCVPISDTCATGYDVRALPDPSTFLNLACGFSITLTGDHIVYLCVDDNVGVQDFFVMEVFTRFEATWLWSSETITSVFNNGVPPLESGAIDSFGTLVAFTGRDTTAVQPQSGLLEIYRILVSNQLALLQTIILELNSEDIVGVCIYDETIVVLADDAFIYEPSGVDTWALDQRINGTQPFTQCSIWDDGLVLSLERSPTGDSYLSYSFSGGMWNLIDTGTTTSVDGSWSSVVVDVNGEGPLSSFPFMVVSGALEIPISVIDINSGTGTNFGTTQYISSTGPAVCNSYERNFIVGDTLKVNSQNTFNFQNIFSGFSVNQNDVWEDDLALFVDFGSNFTAYANFCPRD